MKHYQGTCHCGDIQFHCDGDPLFTQYCHCNKCREVASSSQRDSDKVGYAFTAAYLAANFHIVKGKDSLEGMRRNRANLYYCKNCHSLIYGISIDPALQAGIGVNGNNFNLEPLPDSFKPVRHIWYADRLNDMQDSLPKFKDAPLEQMGSGELYQP